MERPSEKAPEHVIGHDKATASHSSLPLPSTRMQDLIAPRPLRLAAMPSFAFYSTSHTSSPPSYIRSRQSSVRLVSSPSAEAFARISLSDGNDAEHSIDKDRPSTVIEDTDTPASSSPRQVYLPALEYLRLIAEPDSLPMPWKSFCRFYNRLL